MNYEFTSDTESLFDINYSLPAASHSVGLADKSPDLSFDHQSMYFPDHGGVLDIPGSTIKNYVFRQGIPFNITPKYSKIIPESTRTKTGQAGCIDSLLVGSCFENELSTRYSIYRAFGSTFYLDLVDELHDDEQNTHVVKQYSKICFPKQIDGLKYSKLMDSNLLINFQNESKVFKLNKNFGVSNELDEEFEDGQEHALSHISSTYVDSSYHIKDACLNPFNHRVHTLALESVNFRQLEMYDLDVDPNKPFQVLQWSSKQEASTPCESGDHAKSKRKRQHFTAARQIPRGMQQVDNIPTHLVNMLVTTGFRTFLYDPRLQEPACTYVDKSHMDSFLPIEYLRRTGFSGCNSNQFYSLSNVQLRVFDYRFPGVPMNQVSHMLDSESFNSLNFKVLEHIQYQLETLCLSSYGRLCFISFDHDHEAKLINPKSIHLPFHHASISEKISDHQEILNGLDVISYSKTNTSNNQLFSVFQMYDTGEISVRSYRCADSHEHSSDETVGISISSHDDLNEELSFERGHRLRNLVELEPRDILPSLDDTASEADQAVLHLDILDSTHLQDIETRLESKRALERYRKMVNKL